MLGTCYQLGVGCGLTRDLPATTLPPAHATCCAVPNKLWPWRGRLQPSGRTGEFKSCEAFLEKMGAEWHAPRATFPEIPAPPNDQACAPRMPCTGC